MGMYKYVSLTFQNEYKNRDENLRNRIIAWRNEPAVNRLERPTNIARARSLGYRAKQGIAVVRVKVGKGLSKREKPHRGRKPSKNGRFYAYKKSHQAMAEERAARKMLNCEVLNSYYVGEDSQYSFYEVILLDRERSGIVNDRRYAGVVSQRGRAFRGLTSAGMKHRGMAMKGFGSMRNRPSSRANRA
jgi:large subunit ribosomal protein L15e